MGVRAYAHSVVLAFEHLCVHSYLPMLVWSYDGLRHHHYLTLSQSLLTPSFLLMEMQSFPKRFNQEIARAAYRQKAAARHFFDMDNDDPDAWSRWLEERPTDEPERKTREKPKP